MKKINDMTNQEAMDLYMKAYHFAHKAHRGQFRKDGKTRYVTHVINASMLIRHQLYLNDGKFCEIVLLLHDVIEDTEYTYEDLKEMFGYEIADAVNILTRKDTEKKTEYLKRVMLSADERIIRIKTADRISNLRDAIDLDNSKKNLSFKKRYLKNTKDYFFPYIDKKTKLSKDLMLAWYQLRDNSYYGEEFFL